MALLCWPVCLRFSRNETFQSAKLLTLQSAIRRHGVQPSAAIRKLARLSDSVSSRHNPFARLLDIFTFWSAQLMFQAEGWQGEYGAAIRGWLRAVGELEALTALAGFAYEHPDYVFPEVVSGDAHIHAEGMAHPLLTKDKAVCNDVRLGDGVDLLILSGPNMAGKSTFIRSVGVNAVLAQCGAPVRAEATANVTSKGCRLDLRSRFALRRSFAILCRDPSHQGDPRPGRCCDASFVPAGRASFRDEFARQACGQRVYCAHTCGAECDWHDQYA